MATSPGAGGAGSVLGSAVNSAHFFSGEVLASLSVPSFYEHFDVEGGRLIDSELDASLREVLEHLSPVEVA